MNAGMFDRVISLYKIVVGKGKFKDTIRTKTKFGTARANVRYLRGSEALSMNEITEIKALQFNIRYRADISHTTFISYEGKMYDIITIEEVGRKEGLKITANLTK